MSESAYNDVMSEIPKLTNAEIDQRLEEAAIQNERSEMLICCYLAAVRERRIYTKFGYRNISEYAQARFGFGEPADHTFVSQCSFTAPQYSDFLMTESNVIAAVEYGQQNAGEIRAWLESQLDPLFGPGSRAVAFGGYIQVLQKL